jgi:ATP-dependent Clp protease ATP-binding subunit ClpC
LAGSLFSDEAFGRIDCAQLSEPFTVTKLLGPPPGYIGYPSKRDLGDHVDVKTMDPALFYKETRGMETGGVLLFDEIEKADPGVLDVLLTVFDEGYVKTSVGNVIDMRNVIIVITSNLGARNLQHARDSRNKILGFSPSQGNIEKMLSINEINDITMKAVKDWMKPELLSRVTAVIPFVDLDQDALDSIYEIELEKSLAIVRKTITTRITVEDDLKEKLISVCVDRGSGARYISRLVDTYIIDTLAAFYVDEDASEGGFSPLSLFYESIDGESFVIVKHYHGEYRHKIARMIES